jgi:PilZ domain-containing protein
MLSLVEFLMIAGLAILMAAWVSSGLWRVRVPRPTRSQSPRSSDQEETAGRPSPGAWHSPRRGPRYCTHFEIEYLSPQGAGKGTLINLSREGWRIKSDQPVSRGTVLSLRLHLQDQPTALEIDRAIVRWVDSTEFGVELLALRPDAATRLSEYLSIHCPQPDGKPLSALSPFAYN